MYKSLIQKAAFACATALAVASPAAYSAEWTSFKVGQLSGFSLTYAHRVDGQFVLGMNGQVFVQDTYGSPGRTQVSNTNAVTFDPSFVAIRSATAGLIGAGGFGGPSGLFSFDPSAPATAISNTALTTLQNYASAFWSHPTSGRSGWLVVGGNGTAGASNVTFVSNDGTQVGAVTGDLSSYSGGIATDSLGNLYTALADMDLGESEKVLKFTAEQVDTAVLAVINATPAPVAKAAATLVFKMDASGSIAVDSAGRLWAGGYQIPHLQVYDPISGLNRRFVPDHAKLKGAFGPPSYSVQSYTRNAESFVSFLANDSFYGGGSDLILGYKPVAQLTVRSVQFTTLTQTVGETAGTVNVSVSVTPVPTAKFTVPVTYAGTATKGKDYTTTTASLAFNVGESSKTFQIKVIDDIIDEDINSETLVIKLGNPIPTAQAGLGALGAEQITLTIQDDDLKPLITTVQPFGTPRIGSDFSYQVDITGGAATRFTAKGLPPGLTINPVTGEITGRPLAAGEFDQVWITATNAAGTSTSRGYIINVEDYAAPAHGTFIAVTDRQGTATDGLGARVDITTTATGTFTGKVYIGAKPYQVSGPLDTSGANPTGSAPFKRGATTVTLTFSLDATNGEFSGALSGGTSFTGGWRAQTSTLLTGPHNFLLAVPGGAWPEVPEGTGYGSVNVQANGKVTISGRAADGSPFTSSACLGANGDVVVYQALYKVPGSLIGEVNVADDAAHTVTGALTWSKPNQGTGNLYATGWDPVLAINALGGKYRPAAGSTIAMDLPAEIGNNGRILLQDGGIASTTSVPFRISAPAVIALATPNKLSIVNNTGAFTGSITVGAGLTKKTFPIQGLLVPDGDTPNLFDSEGHGYFLLPATGSGVTRSGMVLIEALP